MPKDADKVKHEGGVRKYLPRGPLQRLRQARHARRLGHLGEGAYIDADVQFLRHPENMRIGARVIVKEGARLCTTNPDARLSIGDWTTVGYHTFIFANSTVEIGANCLIAPFCYLVDTNHGIRRDRLIREQPMSSSPIRIGDDVWLGTGVTVLRGVTIGTGAVVGAGAVVSGDVEDYAIVAGNPAQVTGHRQ